MHLHGAMLFVKDLSRMAEFYGKTLGLQPIAVTRTDVWVEFSAGNSALALHAIPKEIADHIEISSPPRPREGNPVRLVFEMDDVERERTRLAALEITMLERPWEVAMESTRRATSSNCARAPERSAPPPC